MRTDQHRKVTASHLKRSAYLYVRQSTLRQVFENTESTRRQYELRDRAVALGWPREQVIVIDTDLGQSGASAADREGFQKLVTEVGLGNAGIVLGLEVSRLARNSSDWHRLLEICALSDTLLLDEDGIYSPRDFNDRLLLGLKGTMSEAELHFLRARLRGGIESKARRGELRSLLPVGLAYDNQNKVVLDPDKQIQDALRSFFSVYERVGSGLGVVRYFREAGLLFPSWTRGGTKKGELVWGPLGHTRALQVLHNPRYAGAFFFGRTRATKTSNGRHFAKSLPQDEWHTLIPDAHPGYISWAQYQRNQKRLAECARWRGSDRMASPPGKGPALLQGIAICGACGRRMTVRYHDRRGQTAANYVRQSDGIDKSEPICQSIQGPDLERAGWRAAHRQDQATRTPYGVDRRSGTPITPRRGRCSSQAASRTREV
jgi:DNA invertase Pin-like site-specific DNA recombinase